ncbi:hypothetical protein DAEQUDRAFT_45415 [Daedalea quercina L-15889]|uniref:Transmembrane protein n=1 Tax=Daedalea quercina L-15889 TaxID=1314783 RepID=A0A165LBY2_9APHY|nr:hypothetical protein DAEQUDRAFT_45415 [Daedalea quercina L-15889]
MMSELQYKGKEALRSFPSSPLFELTFKQGCWLMRCPTIVSVAFVATIATSALALPWHLGVRDVEDALAQRSFEDKPYARELVMRTNSDRSGRLKPIPRLPMPNPPNPHPPRPRPPHPGPHPPRPAPNPPYPQPRDLEEYLLVRALEEDELFARAHKDGLFARMEMEDLD